VLAWVARGHYTAGRSAVMCLEPGEPMAERASIVSEVFKFLLAAVYAVLLVLLGPVSVWLVFGAETAVGKGLAAMGLLTLVIAADLFVWFRRTAHPRLWGWSTVVLAVVWVGLGYFILQAAPSGEAPEGSPVSHRFTSSATFSRYALANVVPEVEQVDLGLLAAPLLDPVLTHSQARRVSRLAGSIYGEMERDANFHALGSAMSWTYADRLGLPFDVGHYYLYVPRSAAAGRRGAIVFLHGSAGNFKAYTWIFSHLAERLGYVLIAPSYGMGDWRRPGAPSAVLRALEHASKLAQIDPHRVFLAGLSNGGVGVCRLARDHPGRFRGLVLISPVMAGTIVNDQAFREHWRGRRVLILTGQADRRVRIDSIRRHAEAMKSGGVNVRQIVYPGEDHFLLFSEYRKVLEDLGAWLAEADASRRPGTSPTAAWKRPSTSAARRWRS